MLPQAIMLAVAALLAAISKLIAAGEDKAMQEAALYEADESLKKALDHFKFGDVPTAPPTQPGE